MPGMFLMSGFDTDEFYSTPLLAAYDGQEDFSFGLAGMVSEEAAADEAIFSCHRITNLTGWELRTGDAGTWDDKTTQEVEVVYGTVAPAEASLPTTALAAPHSMAMRPFFIIATIEVGAGPDEGICYFNGAQEGAANVNAAAVLAANAADEIVLGHGFNAAGAAARGGTHWYVELMFLESSILGSDDITSLYNAWLRRSPELPLHHTGFGLDHVWYVEDAMIEGAAEGETAATWYSRPGVAGGTPLAMTRDVDTGLIVTYYPNVAFSL